MKETKRNNQWALVTGASSGFGADFARELGALGYHLVLTARRQDRLDQVAREIIDRFGVTVNVMPMDLSRPDAPQQLYEQIKSESILVDILINNAGYGIYGEFAAIEWARQCEMLQVNILALTCLTKLFMEDMVARNFGYILNVSSISAYQPSPLFATYGASKSYVLNFSEALNYELRHCNVHCTAISPGPVVTEFQKVSGVRENHPYIWMSSLKSADVARIGIEAMFKGKPSVVPDWKVKLAAWVGQRAPRRTATTITGWLMSL